MFSGIGTAIINLVCVPKSYWQTYYVNITGNLGLQFQYLKNPCTNIQIYLDWNSIHYIPQTRFGYLCCVASAEDRCKYLGIFRKRSNAF